MTRFGRLEFEVAPKSPTSAAGHPPARVDADDERDQHYWLHKATDERRNGNFETSLRYYSRALEFDKSFVAGWMGQVQMLIALDEHREADLWSRKALELFKNNPDLLASRSQALCRMGDLKNAIATNDAALAQQGDFSAVWIARGELMAARKETAADHCFSKAILLDPDWLNALEIGGIQSHHGQTAKALPWFRRASQSAPGHAYCWYRQGMCERELGFVESARQSLRQCIQLSPKHEDAKAALLDLKAGSRPIRNWFHRLFHG